jgi:hypothetical protein
MTRQTLKTTAYWVTTVFGPASFVIGGMLAFSQSPDVIANFQHLGYPAYFGFILGTWKVLGAITTVVPGLPRLKEWAYAGFFFELTSAAVSRAAVGDSIADIIAPLGFLALVAASWALRPQGRKLAAPAVAPREQTVRGQLATALM